MRLKRAHHSRCSVSLAARISAHRPFAVCARSRALPSVTGIFATRIGLSTWQFPELAKAIEYAFRARNDRTREEGRGNNESKIKNFRKLPSAFNKKRTIALAMMSQLAGFRD